MFILKSLYYRILANEKTTDVIQIEIEEQILIDLDIKPC